MCRKGWSSGCKHVYTSLFVSQGELHLQTDLWTCHPVEKTWAGRHCQCQCPELTPSFSPPDSFIGFVAPSPCHLQSQGSEWHIEEEVGTLTTPPASSRTCIATGCMSILCKKILRRSFSYHWDLVSGRPLIAHTQIHKFRFWLCFLEFWFTYMVSFLLFIISVCASVFLGVFFWKDTFDH